MINRGATFISRLAVIFAVLFTFTACGGGGGGGSSFYQGDDSEQATLFFAMYDPVGNSTNTITSSNPGTLKVTVKNAGPNVVVSASTDLGTLFPSTGTALTDGGSVATFQLEAGAEKGAGTVTASATVNGVAVTGTFGFQIGDNGLRLGYFDANGDFVENQISIQPQGTLAPGGNAQLSVVILNKDGERVGTVEDVRFNSGCIGAGQATINPVNPVKSANGQASTTYTAAGCAGVDSVTATLVGAAAQATGSITVASPQANAVNFVSAAPTLIVLRGTGGANRIENSEVVFKVVDSTGAPIPGVSTALSLSTQVGGLSLSKSSALSDGEGLVKVIVSSGDVATTVRVIATINNGGGQTVATASDLITVTTGLPDQNSISLSVGGGGFVVGDAMTTDGLTRTLSVRMADKFNNPVVDGTAAVFTTEYGAIVGSCTTVGGTCSVQWNSQEPRYPTLTGTTYIQTIVNDPSYSCPSHLLDKYGPCPEDLGYIRGGRSTILVTAIGEESFIDRNGNGIMDEDERYLFDNLPEAFIDNNEDGYYTPSLPQCLADPYGSLQCIAGLEEIFVDFNSNEKYDYNDDPPVYNGLLCPPEGNGVWCSRDLVNVRDEAFVILGSPDYYIIMVRNQRIVDTTVHGQTQQVVISDIFNNRPPAESTVKVEVSGDCKLVTPSDFTVSNTAARGAYTFPLVTTIPDTFSDPFVPGTIKISLEPTEGPTPQPVTFYCDDSQPVTDPCDPNTNPSPLPDFCNP
ncbi:MAG: hypothetical protein R3E50_17625 [Halioglobus sp.]